LRWVGYKKEEKFLSILSKLSPTTRKRDQFERGSLNRAAMTVAIDELLYVGDFIMKRGA
jgi:hypothetical protein